MERIYLLKRTVLRNRLIPHFSGLVSVLLIYAFIYNVQYCVDTSTANEYNIVRINLVIKLIIGFILWLLLYWIGFLSFPKAQSEYIYHAKGSMKFREELRNIKEQIADSLKNTKYKVDLDIEAEYLLKKYMDDNIGYFTLKLCTYILNVISIILLFATFSYVIVNTSSDPSKEYANLDRDYISELVSDKKTLNEYIANLNSNRISGHMIDDFKEKGIFISDYAYIVTIENNKSWYIYNPKKTYRIILRDNKIEVSKRDDFATHAYFSAVTFFTIGYGEFHPASLITRIATMVQCFSILLVVIFGVNYFIAFESNRIDRVGKAIYNELKLSPSNKLEVSLDEKKQIKNNDISQMITEEDRNMAKKCIECKTCYKARKNQNGLIFLYVKIIKRKRCPLCKAYEKVYRRKAYESIQLDK